MAAFLDSTDIWKDQKPGCFSSVLKVCGEIGTKVAAVSTLSYSERSKRTVQMRLYTLHKRHLVLVFIVFLLCFGITVIVGAAGPAVTFNKSFNASALPMKPHSLQTGPYSLKVSQLSPFNQQIWLLAVIYTDDKADETLRKTFTVSVTIQGDAENPNTDSLVITSENRSRVVECSGKVCDELVIFHLGYIRHESYSVIVQFYGLDDGKINIEDVQFEFKGYNSSFTQIEIWFRFVFLLVSFILTCMFSHSLHRYFIRDWAIEQKCMSVLLPLLLFYNDPLFPLGFLVNSSLPSILDAIFQTTFLCGLLFFWLVVYHALRQNERRFCSFYLPKLLLVGFLWLAATTLSIWQVVNQSRDPSFSVTLDTGNFMGFRIFFFIVGFVYLLYLLYLLVRGYVELRHLPYFDLRLKLSTALMVLVLCVSAGIVASRFGGAVLKDNFVAQLSFSYSNSAEFMSLYGLLNLYIFTMAFLFSPANNATVDNPAFSMLPDTDEDEEDVLYGSDNEDKSLTSSPK